MHANLFSRNEVLDRNLGFDAIFRHMHMGQVKQLSHRDIAASIKSHRVDTTHGCMPIVQTSSSLFCCERSYLCAQQLPHSLLQLKIFAIVHRRLHGRLAKVNITGRFCGAKENPFSVSPQRIYRDNLRSLFLPSPTCAGTLIPDLHNPWSA